MKMFSKEKPKSADKSEIEFVGDNKDKLHMNMIEQEQIQDRISIIES